MAEPLSDKARVNEARQHHLRGDFARAISLYDEVLAGNPALGDVWHLKGMAEHQAGRLDQALESAARARSAGGEKATYLLLEGGVLHDRGDPAGAYQRFARAAAVAPEWAPAHIELGTSLLDQERVPEALESFRRATTLDPKSVRGWNNLGIALQSLDRLDEALRAFNFALSLNPGFALAHFNAARLYNLRYEHKLALQHAPRCNFDHLFLLREQVAQYHRGARQPGGPPQRSEIGHAVEIAIAGLPAGVLIAGDDIHFHITGQQVVAGVHAIVGHMIHKEVAGDPLAHQTAVHIWKNRQHRFYLAALDQVAKFGAGQHAGDWAMVHISPLLEG